MPAPDAFPTRYGPWALVAGAAVGLGAEYARQLAARGLAVAMIDRDAGALEATAAEIRAGGGAVRTLALDLARPDLGDAVRAATADLEIGLLVYNAAIGTVSPFLEVPTAGMQAMLDVNCRGPLLLAHALLPAMVARRRGGIVLMSSMAADFGSAQLAVYAATKAFDLVLAEALWAELREHGVDVLAVQPGSTRTPGWQASQPPELRGPGPHVMEPPDVVREALAALGVEPTVVPGEANRQGAQMLATLPRRDAIALMSRITATLLPTARTVA
ncbi:MAG: SDR family NAD(P)-dependent oxidoreductase [Deltaproteobacteria bacterium]|nr:SDR family NAD(P)-dependent oxidoreductase [Deltaproteobacteria bacterium]